MNNNLFRFVGINVDPELEESLREEARLPRPSLEGSVPGGELIGLGGNLEGENRSQVDEKSHENGPA